MQALHHALIEIFTSKLEIAVSCDDFEDPTFDGEQGHIERTSSQIEKAICSFLRSSAVAIWLSNAQLNLNRLIGQIVDSLPASLRFDGALAVFDGWLQVQLARQ